MIISPANMFLALAIMAIFSGWLIYYLNAATANRAERLLREAWGAVRTERSYAADLASERSKVAREVHRHGD